jgi:hypothetical protein
MNQTSILPDLWDLPPLFRRRVGVKAGRQRAMQADDHLLLITHLPPKPGEKHRTGRFFWRDPSGQWSSNDLGKGISTLSRHLEDYKTAIEKLEKEEEHAVGSGDYFRVISHLSPLLRSTRNLHSALQDARELTGHDQSIINLRDRAYDLERKADLLYSEAKNELDFMIAMQTEEQAANSYRMSISAHRLNILVAFFFPIVTLATIFGSNLEHGMESLEAPWPFIGMLALGIMLGLGLNAFVNFPINKAMKKRREPGARPPQEPG